MFKTFWGEDMDHLAKSNRRAVVPGAWRIEITPAEPSREDVFLNALEIGDRGAPPRNVVGIYGYRLGGAAVEGDSVVLFATERAPDTAEATVPDVATRSLVLAGLEPRATYALQLTSSFAPGAPEWRRTAAADDAGVLSTDWDQRNGRLRLRKVAGDFEVPR
jgi:hypothetical protein